MFSCDVICGMHSSLMECDRDVDVNERELLSLLREANRAPWYKQLSGPKRCVC